MSMFWTTLLSSLILTASTGTALGAALGLTGLIILHYFADGATSLAINAVWNILMEFLKEYPGGCSIQTLPFVLFSVR